MAGVGCWGRVVRAGFRLDLQGLAVDKGIGHFAARRFDDAREGGSGDFHLIGGGFLILTLEVGEPEGLDFIETKDDELEFGGGDAGGLEQGYARLPTNEALAEGTRHVSDRLVCGRR